MAETAEGYRLRLVDERISRILRTFGAVRITGPKGCGKTRTSCNHAESIFDIGDSEDGRRNRGIARMQTSMALVGDQPRLIDEWQEVPALWDGVRNAVDRTGRKGQFILTGSSTPPVNSTMHTGELRVGDIRMHTMSLYETGDSDGTVSLKELMNGEFNPHLGRNTTLEDLVDFCIRGGWPANLDTEPANYGLVPLGILEDAIDSATRTDGIRRDKIKMELLFRALARNESTLAGKNVLKKDISERDDGISDKTLNGYLDCLDRLFVIEDLPPYSPDFRTPVRIRKGSKRHLADPSLAVAALKLNRSGLADDMELMEAIFETLCSHDMRIYAETNGFGIFHYHDDKNLEADIIITDGPDWAAFEVRLGAQDIDAGAESLLKLARRFDGISTPKILCVICGLSGAAYRREDGVYVVPITSLRD